MIYLFFRKAMIFQSIFIFFAAIYTQKQCKNDNPEREMFIQLSFAFTSFDITRPKLI